MGTLTSDKVMAEGSRRFFFSSAIIRIFFQTAAMGKIILQVNTHTVNTRQLLKCLCSQCFKFLGNFNTCWNAH